ncbi:MAG: hypothetical protein FJ387_26995 [Verrucomicrobia bacterium]|nr:hypothetical protein [Verrucomicrobiota bacterium]
MKSPLRAAHRCFFGIATALPLIACATLHGQTPVTNPLDRWVRQSPEPTTKPLHHIAFLDGQFIATAEQGVLLESNDGVVWTEFIAEVPNASFIPAFTAVAFGKGLYAGTDRGGNIYTSPDRLVWPRHANVNGLNAMNDVIFDGTAFLAVGNQSAVYRSMDGSFWARATGFVDGKNVVGIAQGDGQFVAVGGWELWGSPPESLIATSPGGQVWTVNETTFSGRHPAVGGVPRRALPGGGKLGSFRRGRRAGATGERRWSDLAIADARRGGRSLRGGIRRSLVLRVHP